MGLGRRLRFYGIGLVLGTLLALFIVRKKTEGSGATFCYLPNCRVLKALRTKPLAFSRESDRSRYGMDADSISFQALLEAGNVDFSDGAVRGTDSCKTYTVEHEGLRARLTLCPDTTRVLEVIDMERPHSDRR